MGWITLIMAFISLTRGKLQAVMTQIPQLFRQVLTLGKCRCVIWPNVIDATISLI